MASFKQHRYYRGVLLPELCDKVGIDNKEDAIKEFHGAFKGYVGVDSTADLTDWQFECYMNFIRMFVCREYGILLKEPNENFDIETIEFKDFLTNKLSKYE